jgi:uncharacterized protein (TIGR03000 family)
MIQKLKWTLRTTAIVGALLVMTSGDCFAARGGGGGHGGGGGRGGSYGRGGERGYGGYGRGYGGFGGGYGYGGYGGGIYLGGVGYGYPYSGYGYPEGYGYDPSTYQAIPAVPSYQTQAVPSYQSMPGYQSATMAPAAMQADAPARIRVSVPDANATVTFDGAKTSQTGTVREFESTPLAAGDYVYEVTASWMQDGHLTTKTEKVHVTPGREAVVNFPNS